MKKSRTENSAKSVKSSEPSAPPKLELYDRRGNLLKASDVFGEQIDFNKPIYAPACGIHSLAFGTSK